MPYLDQLKSFEPADANERKTQDMVIRMAQAWGEDFLTRVAPTHLTACGFIVNNTLDKTLFIHHKLRNAWGWTGGHMDKDRDIIAVALKEAREETGIQKIKVVREALASLDLLEVEKHVRRGEDVEAHTHVGACVILRADENASTSINEVETYGMRWIPFDTIDQFVDAIDLKLYQKILRRLRSWT